jgi:hypothetical protein
MPNHVTNEIWARKEVLDSLAGPKSAMDFNTVVPMPQSLVGNEPDSAVVNWAKIAMGLDQLPKLQSKAIAAGNPADAFKRGDYRSATDVLHLSNVQRMLTDGPFPKDFNNARFEKFIACCRSIKECGYAFWYDWCNEKWGTKWNAYDVSRISDTILRFDTAWSMPFPVIEELSKKFPTDEIRVRWADEDTGANTGDLTVFGGEVVSGDRLPNYSREAYDVYLALKHDGVLRDDMVRTESGKIEYVKTV